MTLAMSNKPKVGGVCSRNAMQSVRVLRLELKEA